MPRQHSSRRHLVHQQHLQPGWTSTQDQTMATEKFGTYGKSTSKDSCSAAPIRSNILLPRRHQPLGIQRPRHWLPTRFSIASTHIRPISSSSSITLHAYMRWSAGWCRSDGVLKGIRCGISSVATGQPGLLHNTGAVLDQEALADRLQKVAVGGNSGNSALFFKSILLSQRSTWYHQ